MKGYLCLIFFFYNELVLGMNYVLEHLRGEGGWDAEVNDQYLLFCSTLLSEKVSHEARSLIWLWSAVSEIYPPVLGLQM